MEGEIVRILGLLKAPLFSRLDFMLNSSTQVAFPPPQSLQSWTLRADTGRLKGQDNDQLLEEYRNVISHLIQSHNDKTRELEDNHSAEIDHIHADHQEMIMQLKDDHEVEHQAQMLVLDTLQTHIDHLQEEHQEMITQLKDDHEVEHQVQMQELDTLQTHIDHIQADHQETIKQLKDDHEVEHQAQVQELDTLSQTYQAKMSAMEAGKSPPPYDPDYLPSIAPPIYTDR